ncbi:MAG TPA: BTAD domain-containing putative transcriptional regulator, partial [Thermoanaerobaculia bacterium]|nr:BTAD domain-containing putative transcriptional regulator [Thermoanaerobaculia bacterium]
MHLLEIHLLGQFSAADHRGDALSVGNRRTQALVNYLALSIDSGGSASEISRLLPGERVRDLIADLRYAFRFLPSELVIVEEESIRFNPVVVSVDAQRFEMLAARTSLNAIRAAADLYSGNLLEGYASGYPALDEWIQERRLHYWQLAVGLYGRLLAAQIRAGWWQRAVETASRLLSLDPSQEVVHRTLMRLQLEEGRPDSALRRYHECADVLHREFGRAPGPETERVHEEIVAALERAPAPREAVSRAPDRPVLVLLVEDDAVSSALVEGFLDEAGYEVVTVADGADALLEIGRRRFDLLILDVNVPTLSGLHLFEIMIRKGIETPALVVSGVEGAEAEARSLEMG